MKSRDWNWGLEGACWGGHRDLVELMIDKGADLWDEGLVAACRGGHRDLVEWMIDKGADDWNWGLEAACHGGHRDLVELMITKGDERGFAFNWNWGLKAACNGGHCDFVEWMINKGATNLIDITENFTLLLLNRGVKPSLLQNHSQPYVEKRLKTQEMIRGLLEPILCDDVIRYILLKYVQYV
jgi:hypothetical protein